MKVFTALVLTIVLTGCGLGSAAKVMKSYRISLGAFQDAEISAFQQGQVPQDKHTHMQADVEKLANLGIDADRAILASDKATVIQDINTALTVVAEIEQNDVTAFGNPTTKAAVEVAVAGLSNLLQQVSIAAGGK
jgi:hypothetical protein